MVAIKLTKDMQMNLMMVNIGIMLATIYLFNLFWEPLFFMLTMSYLIMNKGRQLTRNELLIGGIAKLLLLYACVARLFGRGPGITVIVIPALVLLVLYFHIWRSRTK
jgi:hypothetical protein